MRKWDASLYDGKHAFVFKYGEELIELLAPQPGERILDVGCGTGHLTSRIAEAGAKVTGLDSSPEMIASARAAYPALDFRLADVADFRFGELFDAVFSNAVLHWVKRAEDAVRSMSRALRPGGRFVVEFGGYGNVAHIDSTVEEAIREVAGREGVPIKYYPRISEYSTILERNGLQVASALLFDRFTRLEEGELGLRNWIMMFRGELLSEVTDEEREQIFRTVEGKTREVLFRDGSWYADYRRLRITAFKEG